MKVYGGTEDDEFDAVAATSDGCMIVAASSLSADGDTEGNAARDDVWILKLGRNGELEWKRTFEGIASDWADSVIESSDGNCVVAGGAISPDGDFQGLHRGNSDGWAAKLDPSGNVLWRKNYGGEDNETAISVIEADGGFVIAGMADSPGSGRGCGKDFGVNALWIVILDADGNQLDAFCPQADAAPSQPPTAAASGVGAAAGVEAQAIVAGISSDPDRGRHAWIASVASDGGFAWKKAVSENGSQLPRALSAPDGGGAAGAGCSGRPGDGRQGGRVAWVFRISQDGTVLWQIELEDGGQDACLQGITATGEGYFAAGTARTSELSGMGASDHLALMTDGKGNALWSMILGGGGVDFGKAVAALADGRSRGRRPYGFLGRRSGLAGRRRFGRRAGRLCLAQGFGRLDQ
ncbi:MAG: hypothetical protein LBR80_00565 [Deltaproteobacteria bacterium]|jgi:hypothetical protein|nr:hypothetical protein [Deltaproteobacteria bacterium]